MKMKMIPSGNYLLADVLQDLAERYVKSDPALGNLKSPRGENFLTGIVTSHKFTASYVLQQSLLDQTMIAYFTDSEDVKKVPRGFWRDKNGNDAIWSGVAPELLSTEREWLFINQSEYENLLTSLGMTGLPGGDLISRERMHPGDASARKPMSAADIRKAVDFLKVETQTKSLTREQQQLSVRQTFADKHVTEANWRQICREIPVRAGRPRKKPTDKPEGK